MYSVVQGISLTCKTLWAVSAVTLLLASYILALRVRPSRRKSRNDGLVVVNDPGSATEFEIIAVHGLGAHPEHTWEGKAVGEHHPKPHLLRNLLPSTFPTARILSFGYNSDWFVDAPEKTAHQIGQRLLKELAERRISSRCLPVVFVGHSFGGIVIKEALCVSPQSSAILEDTCGIIFLGTPHLGSSLSTTGALMAELTRLLGSNTSLLLNLRSHGSQLSDLESRFRSAIGKAKLGERIISFYETKPTLVFGVFSVGLVVDRDSATGYAARPTSIDTSHAGLNKFHNTEDRGYVELKAAIEQLRVKSVLEQADDYIREKCYTASMLQIERLSGETLLMEQCYINLALVAQIQTGTTTQHIPNDDGTALRSSPFSLFARQKVETTAEQIQIRLAEVFQPRQNFNGTEMVPRKILIRGRAGVGKTTLCKKMVHEFKTNTMWSDLFDRVLWIPLRNLKSETDTKYGLRDFFDHEYFQFSGQDKLEGSTRFAKEIHDALKHHRTLFILDGWDELAEIDKKSYMFRFLKELLHQSNVIITTRPSATLPDGIKLDLELETTGFSPAQVDEYIVKVHKDDADELRLFLQAHELMAGLVRIPILLDAFCYCWNNIGRTFEETPQTMTTLYQTIETSLWKKDIVRLDKEKTQNLAEVEQRQIETQFIEHELHFLEHLAFTGMVVDKIEFSLEDRRKANLDSGQRLLLDKTLPCLSFLRTSAPQAKSEHRLYHFIHLTFQEYFAARCFVQQWRSKPNFECFAVGHKKLSPNGFLRRYKYDARYDIMWRFVAGLLDDKGEEEIVGFFKKIKSEPVDLLGPTHQRLIMHCLDEAVCLSSGPYRMRMEGRLSQWLLFECSFRGSASLASESEFPDNALHNALQICTGRDRVTILQALNSRGRCISRDTLAVVTTLLQDKESDVRSAAARAIDGQPNLPESAIAALIPLLQEKESDVRSEAARAIGSQSNLPESAIATLIALLQHEKGYVRSEAAEAIGGQSNVLDQLLEASRVVLISESSTSTTESVSCHSSFIECLYRPLLWRSFREQSSLYVDGNHYFVNQQSGLRRIARVHDDTSQCEAAQKSVNSSEFDLWGAIENTEEL